MRLLEVLLFLIFPFCNSTSYVNPNFRVDCYPDPGSTKERCEARGCFWDPNTEVGKRIPFCHFPSNIGYNYVNVTEKNQNKWHLLQKSSECIKSPFGEDEKYYYFIEGKSNKWFDLSLSSVDDPWPKNDFVEKLNYRNSREKNDKNLIVEIKKNPLFSFTVKRADNGLKIWDTNSFLFSKQYIQFSTLLPTNKIVGFGEHAHLSLTHDLTKYITWPMFARDQTPNPREENRWTQNLYGIHNFYMGIEPDGRAHGVFVMNLHAQEVTTGPGPHLTYRFLGGPLFFQFFDGPTPEDVVRQYHYAIGKSYLPSYWALGYQFSRYGFRDLKHFGETIDRIYKKDIPLDVVYADIDYMEKYKDFTYDKEKWKMFPYVIDYLHNLNMKLTLIFDPAIQVDYDTFERGLQSGATFISWPNEDMVQHEINNQYPLTKNTTIMLGNVWPQKHVAFPNFVDTKTRQWWIDELVRFHKVLKFDGIWIDMNEPSNFGTELRTGNFDVNNMLYLRCPVNELERPPYASWAAYNYGDKFPLCHNTLCMSGTIEGNYTLYNTRPLWVYKEIEASFFANEAINNERGQVISRSTFAGSGRFGGHWTGDNSATWLDLLSAVVAIQEFNMFGITHVGSDVCGFNGPSNEELCLRWHQLGAFHSFYRNHNANNQPDQDPAKWESVAITTKTANLFRYQHLPFLYTLHFLSHINGGTVVRPVFFEFPHDLQAVSESFNFLWGSSLLICPVLHPFVDEIYVYLPYHAEWYSLYQFNYGLQIPSGFNVIPAPRNSTLPVFLRAGFIIPRQTPARTTFATRQNNLQLITAIESRNNTARGELVWDDGKTFSYDYQQESYQWEFRLSVDNYVTLKITRTHTPKQNKVEVPKLDQIEILGYNVGFGGRVTVNDKEIKTLIKFNRLAKQLVITFRDLVDIQNNDVTTIRWPKKR